MPSRAWIVVFAIGWLIASGASGQPSKPEEPQRVGQGEERVQNQNDDGDERGQIEQPAIPPDDPSPANTASDQASEASDKGDAEKSSREPAVPWWEPYVGWSDTAAQWLMALSGVIALILSAWAVWLLRETLVATRAAIREAERGSEAAIKAANAADRQVAVSREAAIVDQRAWISINEVKFSASAGPADDEIKISISTKIKNFGRTPCRVSRPFAEIEYSYSDADFFNRFERPKATWSPWSQLIFPGEFMTVNESRFISAKSIRGAILSLNRKYERNISVIHSIRLNIIVQYITLFDNEIKITSETHEIRRVSVLDGSAEFLPFDEAFTADCVGQIKMFRASFGDGYAD